MSDTARETGAASELRDQIAEATREHWIEDDACVCGQWADGKDGPDWDEHMADVALPIVEPRLTAATELVDQLTDLLGIANRTSNTSEQERTHAVQRAEQAERHRDQAENRASLYREQVRSEHDRATRAEAAIERLSRMAQVWIDTGPNTATGEGRALVWCARQVLAALGRPPAEKETQDPK